MTTTQPNLALPPREYVTCDPEKNWVTHLIQTTAAVGAQTDPIAIVNLYVALKSKPMVILTGMAHTGKIALVQILTQTLIGCDPLRGQMMSGHAWWAGQTGNVALFTDLQARFNDDKFLSLITEALQPENAQRVYVACLSRISPAELIGFFSMLAYQLRHGRVMRLPSVHFTEPIPYPANLLLIGTLDTAQFDWPDADLFSKATIISWPTIEVQPANKNSQTVASTNQDGEFLSSRINNEWSARIKLLRILGKRVRNIKPLFRVMDLLKAQDVSLPDSIVCEVVIYLANAWSKRGAGLFDADIQRNAEIALDLAIAQTILPRVDRSIRSRSVLHDQLADVLQAYPYSMTALNNLA